MPNQPSVTPTTYSTPPTVVIKGFMNVSEYLSNVVGVVAKYGELSNYSASYAKEKGYYTSNDHPGMTLITFTTTRDENKIFLEPNYLVPIMNVIQYVMNYCDSNGPVETFRDVLLNKMANDLTAYGDNFDLGIIDTDSKRWLPEWVSWRIPSLDGGSNYICIWLEDEAFQNQYDDFEITVVPPIANLDDFFLPAVQVKHRVDAVTYEQYMDDVQAAKVQQPETVIRGLIYKWTNPLDATQTLDTNWTVLIYGLAGDNQDDIQDALINYILAHSTHPREDWEVIFPDIFRRTEFLIMPGWFKLALEQRASIAGIYSPLVDVATDINQIKNWLSTVQPEYTRAHLDRATMTVTHNFKCVNLTIVGGPKNRGDKFLLTQWYSDYLSIANTNPDFSRMQQPTCDFANRINDLVFLSETWVAGQPLKLKIRKLKRNGKYWLTFNINRVSYLMWPRSNGDYNP